MTKPNTKRPRDLSQRAKLIVDIVAGDESEPEETGLTKRAAAGGRKGGKVRADRLTPEQRSEIASVAAAARWKKKR